MSQDPYVQPKPQQPQQPQQPPQYPYPGQPTQPYGQPTQPYGQQPYQQQPGYPVAPYGYQTTPQFPASAKPKKSSTLGVIGFALVILTMVGGVALATSFGPVFAEIAALVPPGATQEEIQDILNSYPPEYWDQFGMRIAPQATGLLAVCAAGLVGWIISIIAAATGRGRPWAVGGIILGIVAPIVIFVAIGVGAAGAMA